jgi:hypothetical protein
MDLLEEEVAKGGLYDYLDWKKDCPFTLYAFSLISALPNTITQCSLALVDDSKHVIPGNTGF